MKKKKEKPSPYESLIAIGIAIEIGKKVTSEIKIKYPELAEKLEKPYNGILRPYMETYHETFLKPDHESSKGEVDKELTEEWMNIECFCRWLEDESGFMKDFRMKK